MIALKALLLELVEIICAQFAVSLVCSEHVISNHEHAVSDGNDGAFQSPPACQTAELRGQIAVFLAGGAPCCLAQGSP